MPNRNRLPRFLLVISLLIGLCAGIFAPRADQRAEAKPLAAAATNIVISEFRFRGDGGGNDEFIELYNPTNLPVDISGWLIRGSNNAGAFSTRATINAGTILEPGQYYLVAHTGYTGPVAADQLYGTGITNDGGVAITLSDGTTIIDQVGLSSGSAYKEGTPLPALTTDVDRGYERKLGGVFDSCEDTDDNSADFQLINPSNPQNMNSPLSLCGVVLPTLTPTDTPTITSTPTLTFTPSNTPTTTNTPTLTNTATPTNTPISTGALSVLINEVAWAGTSSTRTSDEWIEFYNTESAEINLNGWKLTIDKGEGEGNLAVFDANDKIPAGGFFLLARAANIFINITVDKTFSTALPNEGAVVLRLYNSQGTLIDTANLSKGSGWYAGTAGAGSPTYASMERRGKVLDGASAWFTFSGTPIARNRDDHPVQGTPKASNWSLTVTATPARTPTATRTFTPTVTPLPPSINARLIINEILVRPGFDWNRDGRADAYDEFIEIKNLSPINVDLRGWRLDDQAVGGVNPFSLPNITLKPGEHAVFYRTQANIPLSDGGGTVRLLNPQGLVYDEFTYIIAKQANRSFCRIPDGSFSALSWQEDCIPTPNLPNTREGSPPTAPGGGFELPNCGLPDTIPADFLSAECRGYGAGIWNPYYWDKDGWQGRKFLPQNDDKWASFIQ